MIDFRPKFEEELTHITVRGANERDTTLRTSSSPHPSIAASTYLALSQALHSLCTPSTPSVSRRASTLTVPSSLPPKLTLSAPGTARTNADESVSKASKEESIRP